jgi:DNA repair protein RecO (recombination protein O)
VSLYRDHGVVLRTWKLGEADRIISLFTRDNGKVRAVAKGVRKSSSRFGARLEPTSHVALQLHRGKGDLDTVTQVELLGRHANIRGDLDRFGHAAAMLEVVDNLTPDREPHPELYEMLYRALHTLDVHSSPLVTAAFFIKVLSLEGVEPHVDACVSCGETEPLVAFDLEAGGLMCGACRRGTAVRPEAVELLQQILGGRLGTALAAEPSPATHEVDQLATRIMEHHIERRLRSVRVLDH